MTDRCPGCGAVLQRDDPAGPGYLPFELACADGDTVCRRCYRLRHYGRAEGQPLSPDAARRRVERALSRARAALVILDLCDFEGGLPPSGLIPAHKPVVLAVNKTDLLPPKASAKEVEAWAAGRWREAVRESAVEAVAAISATKGLGLKRLVEKLRACGGRERALAVVGATSTGKSTLLGRLSGGESMTRPTVSRFPGTTQDVIRMPLEDGGLVLYDTPGYVPGDRVIDLLCQVCAARLVPERKLQARLYNLSPGQGLVLGGFAAFILAGPEPRAIQIYTGDEVVQHRTGGAKAAELCETRPEWLLPWACASCRPAGGFRLEEMRLEAGEDLAVAGLGWISLRGGPSVIQAIVPRGARLARRRALFGPRGS